jgi:hypothetical protein
MGRPLICSVLVVVRSYLVVARASCVLCSYSDHGLGEGIAAPIDTRKTWGKMTRPGQCRNKEND